MPTLKSKKWLDVSKYGCDRQKTKNKKFALYVRSEFKQKEKEKFFEKVRFD
jgi:hypothetical protein